MSQTPPQVKRRRPPFPWFGRNQLWITISLAAVLLGSMLPWWDSVVGRIYGLDNYGMYTLWAAALGLAGALSVRRSLFDWLPAVGAAIALGVTIWVLTRGSSQCVVEGGSICRPAYGLIVTGAAAINALVLSIRVRLTPSK